MSNIENRDVSLQDIVTNISKNGYLIPKFQRPFVWTTKDIVDLGDSIIRGYPISSLLMMPENGTLKVGSAPLITDDLIIKNENENENENELKYYILDGQQRITSISKLFLAVDNKKEYYFDLLAILDGKYPEDKLQKDRGIQKKCMKSNVTEILCRSFPIGKDKSEKPTRQNNRFISGKNIITEKSAEIIDKFLKGLEEATKSDYYKYMNHLNATLAAINGYSIPSTTIAGNSELGVVIRVFEKVNSTGKKLTLFDLINAKSFQVKDNQYKGGLSDYLTNQIIKITEENENLTSGVNIFLKYDEDKESFEKLDRIARIIEIMHLIKKGSTPSIFQSAMLSKEPEFWFENWIKEGQKLLEIISWMDDEGLFDIGQITFLEYAIAIFLANPKSFEELKFKMEIKKYTLYLTLSGSTFNKSNLDVVEKIYTISKQITDNNGSKKYDYNSPSSSPNLTQEKILGFTVSKSEFEAIINIFYNDNVNGKFTVDIVGNPIKKMDKSKVDAHHIYPKSLMNGKFSIKSKFNSIANIVLIDSNANRFEIRDKSPKDYFEKINLESKGSFFCKQNLIDIKDVMKIETEIDAGSFIDNRAGKIATIVNSYFT